ncbi:disease resistance RPP13-like protein 4 [Prunus avium]|uniref:Disease resistance RPP13-like protein 4 n=1 Tax=Prunus avium TaxID=42229 RepID=A0A6P5S7M0_PRUAV|nr:disease resistance RPP13-like protein 4 [Prunus avium]
MSSSARDPEKFMPMLLARLRKARDIANTDDEGVLNSFKNMEQELESMKDLVPRVKHWEKTLFNQLNALERRLDKIIIGTETSAEAIAGALDGMAGYVEQIKVSIPQVRKLMPCPEQSPEPWTRRSEPKWLPAQRMSRHWSQLRLEDRIHKSAAMLDINLSYERLESNELKMCLLSFSIFPEDSVIKKRPLIYWWIGEGFIRSTQDQTAEKVGEEVFENLLTRGLIQSHCRLLNAPTSAVVNSCTMHPWVRHVVISLAESAELFDFEPRWPRMPSYKTSNCRRACLVFDNPISQAENAPNLLTLFNLNDHYLSLKPEWLAKLKKVEVLQLGRWQSSPTHHIEVDDEGFLKGLGPQNMFLKYLSLRGISTITQLPSCIFKLVSLEILDLRACHNLETLPSDISSLRKLTHLDVSECYLLEGMPKGIEKLCSLQVLKGFLVGNRKTTPCKLPDLAKLKKLKRLSIYIGSEATVEDRDFKSLKHISSLCHLKISWAVVSPKLKEKIALQSRDFSLPHSLEKLDLQAFPLPFLPDWLKPSRLQKLKKLYIRGGELDNLDQCEKGMWTVEILRLKYLRNMKIRWPELKELFPHLRYLEKINCNEIEKDIVWCKAQG